MKTTHQKQSVKAALLAKAKMWWVVTFWAILSCVIVVLYAVAHFRLVEAADYHEIGLNLYRTGHYSEAIEEFQRETQISPYYSGAYDCWGVSLTREGRVPEAIALYRKALKIDPSDSHAYDDLALALQAQGRWAESLNDLQVAVRVGPDNPLAHSYLGNTLNHFGRKQEAVKEWRQAAYLRRTAGVRSLQEQRPL